MSAPPTLTPAPIAAPPPTPQHRPEAEPDELAVLVRIVEVLEESLMRRRSDEAPRRVAA